MTTGQVTSSHQLNIIAEEALEARHASGQRIRKLLIWNEKAVHAVKALTFALLFGASAATAQTRVDTTPDACQADLAVRCSLQAPAKGYRAPAPVLFGGVIPLRQAAGGCFGSIQHTYVTTQIRLSFRGAIDASTSSANGALETTFFKGPHQTGLVSATFKDVLLDRCAMPSGSQPMLSVQSTIMTDAAAAILNDPGQAPKREPYNLVRAVSAYRR